MRDPYRILGLSKGASADEVKRAYRQLVKKYHPDTAISAGISAGARSADAKARFQAIADAYKAALADCAARAGQARIDPAPAEAARAYAREADHGPDRTQHAHRPAAGKARADRSQTPRADATRETAPDDTAADTAGDTTGDTTGDRPRGPRDFMETLRRAGIKPFRRRGDDIACTLTLPFLDAARGGPHRVTLPTGRTLDIAIPPGIEQGRQIRLRGQGEKGAAGGAAGDALVTIEIEPHAWFSRDGHDIRLALPVSIAEAVEGAKIQVPTVAGKVWMTVPPGSNTGTVLRLQGRGLEKPGGGRGHQYVELLVVLPDSRDPELAAFVRGWPAARSHDPRVAFGFS